MGPGPQHLPGTVSLSGNPLVRFLCGHVDTEAHVAWTTRELDNALWVRCPRCNVIAIAIAIIEAR